MGMRGGQPLPRQQPPTLTFVCSFAFSLSASVSSPESREQGAFFFFFSQEAMEGGGRGRAVGGGAGGGPGRV